MSSKQILRLIGAFAALAALALAISCRGFFVNPTLTSIVIAPSAPQVEIGNQTTLTLHWTGRQWRFVVKFRFHHCVLPKSDQQRTSGNCPRHCYDHSQRTSGNRHRHRYGFSRWHYVHYSESHSGKPHGYGEPGLYVYCDS